MKAFSEIGWIFIGAFAGLIITPLLLYIVYKFRLWLNQRRDRNKRRFKGQSGLRRFLKTTYCRFEVLLRFLGRSFLRVSKPKIAKPINGSSPKSSENHPELVIMKMSREEEILERLRRRREGIEVEKGGSFVGRALRGRRQ